MPLATQRRRYTLVVLLAVALGVVVVRASSVIALVLPTVLGTLILVATVRRMTQAFHDEAFTRRATWWTVASLYTHLAVGLIITNVVFLHIYFGPDAGAYNAGALQILRHWTTGAPVTQFIPGGKEGFYYLLAAAYWIFGTSSFAGAGLALNATLAASLVPLLTDTTRRLFGEDAARRVLPLAVVMPGLFIWTAQLLKEASVLFLIAFAANCAVRLADRFTLGALLGVTIALASLLTFRGQIAFILSAGLLIGLVFGRRELLGGLGAGLTAISLAAVLVLALGLGYAGFRVALGSNLKSAEVIRRNLAQGANTAISADADVSTTRGALSYLPKGLAYFTFGPFPWQIGGVRELPAVVDVAVWWLLLPSFWRGQKAGRRLRGRTVRVILVPALVTTVALSLSSGNYGVVVRERTQIVVLLLPLIALGLSQRGERAQDDALDGGLVEPMLVPSPPNGSTPSVVAERPAT